VPRGTQFSSVVCRRHMRGFRAAPVPAKTRCRAGSFERRIHQHRIDAVRAKGRRGRKIAPAANSNNRVRSPRPQIAFAAAFAARARDAQRRIDLDQHEIDACPRAWQLQVRLHPTPAPKIGHPDRLDVPASPPPAAWRRGPARCPDFNLPQAQLARREKCILGEVEARSLIGP